VDAGAWRGASEQSAAAVDPERTTKHGPAAPLNHILTRDPTSRTATTVSISNRW
jgi:hypothetical protein